MFRQNSAIFREQLASFLSYSVRMALFCVTCRSHRGNKAAYNLVGLLVSLCIFVLHGTGTKIKMFLQEVGCGGVDWVDLTQDRDKWRAVVNPVMNIPIA
jgi:hypothetical protein